MYNTHFTISNSCFVSHYVYNIVTARGTHKYCLCCVASNEHSLRLPSRWCNLCLAHRQCSQKRVRSIYIIFTYVIHFRGKWSERCQRERELCKFSFFERWLFRLCIFTTKYTKFKFSSWSPFCSVLCPILWSHLLLSLLSLRSGDEYHRYACLHLSRTRSVPGVVQSTKVCRNIGKFENEGFIFRFWSIISNWLRQYLRILSDKPEAVNVFVSQSKTRTIDL